MILGLLKPTEGKINVDDVDVFTNLERWQNKIDMFRKIFF